MKEIKLTKLAKQLNISHSAVSQWKKQNSIPAKACIELEPIIEIPARELFLNPALLFDKFTSKESKTSRVQESYHDKESVKQGDTDERENETSKRHTDTRGDSREDRHKTGICDESAA